VTEAISDSAKEPCLHKGGANVANNENPTLVPDFVRPRTRIVDVAGDGSSAKQFYERYRQLYIGDEIVTALIELSDRWVDEDHSAIAAFNMKRESWELHGGFIETVSADDMLSWLESGSYILVEVAAPGSDESRAFDAVAQRLLRIPTTEWVVPLLDGPDDEVSNQPLYDAIVSAGPSASALTDYLGVLPAWAGYGVAAQGRHAGMAELIRRNKARRQDAQVRYLIGLIFAVQGVDLLGGRDGETVERSIRLSDFGEREISNLASLRTNRGSRRSPAHLIGKRKSRPGVRVTIGTVSYALRVDWYYIVQRLDEVSF
jgi:hypothetical protein